MFLGVLAKGFYLTLNKNSILSDLFGVLYGKALVNNHLLFVIVK